MCSAVTARSLHAMYCETKVVPRLEDLALRAPRVEPRVDGIRYKAAVTLDLRNLGKVVEVDHYRAQP